MDRILIKDLLVRCVIGVTEEERREKQDVVVNIALSADLSKPGETDKFEYAVDYSAIKKGIVKAMEGSQYFLVEALAERIAGICLANPAVREARVTVEKPSALRFARSVGVEITRSQKEDS